MTVALARHDVAHLRAQNPGPFTLTGTNTWLIGRDPTYVIDPGPALAEHLDAVAAEAAVRGGAAAILLTHDHHDHTDGLAMLLERLSAPVAAARGKVDVHLADGEAVGPLTAVATPGHAPDHLAYVAGAVAFTGDAVLGSGSVFIAPDPGAMAGYLDGLARLRAHDLDLLCPGHGPPVEDPRTKLDEYIAHRLDRERRLIAALDDGLRSVDQLLDRVWDDAPPELRVAAGVTLEAHLQKLVADRQLPDGVERRDYAFLRDVRAI